MSSNSLQKNPLAQTLLVFMIGSLIIIGTGYIANKFRKPEVVERITEKEKIVSTPICPQNYEEYQNLVEKGQSIELAFNLSSYAVAGKFVNDKHAKITRSGKGQVACGYLYINASVNGQKLNEVYDSVYINPQGFGGHILRSKGVTFNASAANVSEVLLPLNSIAYLPTTPYNPNAQNFLVADWVKLLNVSNQVKTDIALSTQNSKGIIHSIKIAYKCWNSDTGEITENCVLGVTNE